MFPRTNQKGLLPGGLFFVALLFCISLQAQEDKLISVIGVGDMMLGTNYPSKTYLPQDGGNGLLKDVSEILKNADVTFGNLEGTMFDGHGEPKTCRDSTKCYIFRTPASYVRHYYDAGFDIISLANNLIPVTLGRVGEGVPNRY